VNDQIREKNINLFLKKIAKMYQHKDIIPQDIYREIIFDNIPPQKRIDISPYFKEWEQNFKNNTRLNVFVDEKHPTFCQFVDNNLRIDRKGNDPVKIYLSLKPEYLYHGVEQIFKFLSDNSIKHQSKVSQYIRNDNVVIRVYDLKDAVKVMSYINKNHYLVKGHNEALPFCFHSGIVGLAMDNYHSYNTIVSMFLYKYLEYKRHFNKLKEVSCQDFYNFVNQYDIEKEFNSGIHFFCSQRQDIPYVNEIKKLLLHSLNFSNINEFEKHYYSVLGNAKQNNTLSNNEIINNLLTAMNGTYNKYGYDLVFKALYKYLMTSDPTGFTRQDFNGNQCRELITKYNIKEVRQEIIKMAINDGFIVDDNKDNAIHLFMYNLTQYFCDKYFQNNIKKK